LIKQWLNIRFNHCHFIYKRGIKHLIRLFRYIEPPVTNIEVSGGVDGIIFDKEITDEPDE